MSSSVVSCHVICPKCSEENHDSILHCVKCGASLIRVPRAEMLSAVSSQQKPTWFQWTLRTVGVLALIIPVLTANSFMFQVIRFKSSLPAFQTLTIDWNIASRVMLNEGLLNLIGFPVIFYVAAALTFALARALGGKGQFMAHSYALSVAYLKAFLVIAGIGALTLAIPAARMLNFAGLYVFLKWTSEAIAEVHSVSRDRGCVTMLPLMLILVILTVVGAMSSIIDK